MELLEYLSNKQLLTKDFVGTDSVRQAVSGLVQIRTAGLVLAAAFYWDIAPRHVHLTLPKSQAPALYPRRTKNHRKCVQVCH